jgi:glyoxylase-like metal-dependent hydrolase (beta-lactamase superfamily II)
MEGRTMAGDRPSYEAIVQGVHVDGMSFDVRCFLVPHASGVVLIDTGMPGSADLITAALDRIGAGWSDITDIVLTHKHFDHVAGLADVAARTGSPAVWAAADDRAAIPYEGAIGGLEDGDVVRGLRAVATPGHTPGHRSLAHDGSGVLFAGDIAGTMGGRLTRGPEQFTEDAEQAERTLRQVETLAWERLVYSHGDEVSEPRRELRRLLEERGSTPA